MLQQRRHNKQRGEYGGSLVEIVVVLGIIVGALIAILGLASVFIASAKLVQQTSQATLLAQETLEIVRNYRDGTDWSAGLGSVSLSPALYHGEQLGTPPAWSLVSGSEVVGIFTRSVQFEEVFRDGSDSIMPIGNIDSETVQAVVTVSWETRGKTHNVKLNAYLTNWQE